MLAFLADAYHGVLTGGDRFLADRPVAGDVARIHAWVIGTLQATLFPVALVKLASAVSARRHPAQFQQLVRTAVPVETDGGREGGRRMSGRRAVGVIYE